jgi:hypothetical protein
LEGAATDESFQNPGGNAVRSRLRLASDVAAKEDRAMTPESTFTSVVAATPSLRAQFAGASDPLDRRRRDRYRARGPFSPTDPIELR